MPFYDVAAARCIKSESNIADSFLHHRLSLYISPYGLDRLDIVLVTQ